MTDTDTGRVGRRSRPRCKTPYRRAISRWWVTRAIAVSGNPGEHFTIDQDKLEEEARYYGKWVLTTNTDLAAGDVALKYKQLRMVEDIFRSMKSLLETCPIYHQCDETIRGHVFCSFLALVPRKELQDRVERHVWSLEWTDILRELDRLQEVEMSIQGKSYGVRTDTKGTVGKVFQACGAALPPTLRPVEPS